MNDRELLQKAAKAAGHTDFAWFTNKVFGHSYPVLGHVAKPWNPLEDDFDAMGLLVKLDMSVDVNAHETSTYAYAGPADRRRVYAWELWGADKAAATRRAIVRAAAALGDAA